MTNWNRSGRRNGRDEVNSVLDSIILRQHEHGNDSLHGRKLLEKVAGSSRKLFGDEAYDSKGIHNTLIGNVLRAIISPRRNDSTQSNGSPARARVVRRMRKI